MRARAKTASSARRLSRVTQFVTYIILSRARTYVRVQRAGGTINRTRPIKYVSTRLSNGRSVFVTADPATRFRVFPKAEYFGSGVNFCRGFVLISRFDNNAIDSNRGRYLRRTRKRTVLERSKTGLPIKTRSPETVVHSAGRSVLLFILLNTTRFIPRYRTRGVYIYKYIVIVVGFFFF